MKIKKPSIKNQTNEDYAITVEEQVRTGGGQQEPVVV